MVIEQSLKINMAMETLAHEQSKLGPAGEAKAKLSAVYDKELALCIIRLRNGKMATLEGVEIKNPPVRIIEKVAKGICWESALARDKADAMYRSVLSSIETSRALLNAQQSINRYLD